MSENGKDIKMFVISVFFMQQNALQPDILKKIAVDIEFASETVSEDDIKERIIFGKKGYTSHKIDKINFEAIERKNLGKSICFVDGGNSEIIGSTDFSLQFIRTYCCIFKNNKKMSEIKNEFFVLIDSFAKDDDIFYKTKFYPVSGNIPIENFSINSMDEKIVEAARRPQISKVAGIIRRIAELKLAEYVVESGAAEIIVLDGTLESTVGEDACLDKLYEDSLIKNIVICTVAKTANLFTDKGKNAISHISALGGSGIWSCNNIVDIDSSSHKADMSVIKLNKRSRHCFRFEIFNMQKEHKKEVLGCLADNSCDFSFPGYPYGLIVADKFARVSNNEKEYLKCLFLAKTGKKISKFAEETGSNDAHSVLDSIN
jgi:hypothetical protein